MYGTTLNNVERRTWNMYGFQQPAIANAVINGLFNNLKNDFGQSNIITMMLFLYSTILSTLWFIFRVLKFHKFYAFFLFSLCCCCWVVYFLNVQHLSFMLNFAKATLIIKRTFLRTLMGFIYFSLFLLSLTLLVNGVLFVHWLVRRLNNFHIIKLRPLKLLKVCYSLLKERNKNGKNPIKIYLCIIKSKNIVCVIIKMNQSIVSACPALKQLAFMLGKVRLVIYLLVFFKLYFPIIC